MHDVNEDFMVPILFSRSVGFLSGSKSLDSEWPYVKNKEQAQNLLFSQDVPDYAAVWEDYFSSLIQPLLSNEKYKDSQDEIKSKSRLNKDDALKENIRKRKEYLLRKKSGLQDDEFNEFVKAVSDECIYMLNMVSTQRYIYGFIIDSPLEKIFNIFSNGCLPCGISKDKNELLVFNPAIIKG